MTMWIAVLGVAVGSFVLRAAPLTFAGRAFESARIQRVADLAATAALTALVAGAVRAHPSPRSGDLVATVAALLAGGLVARAGRGLPIVLVIGIGTYWSVVTVATLI